MNITNREIIKIIDILSKYADMRLPQHINYAITRNIIAAQNQYYNYTDNLKEIFDKYNDDMIKDENGLVKIDKNGLPILKEEFYPQFKKDIDDLLSKEVDLNIYYLSIEDFNYSDNEQYDLLTAKDILAIRFIIS